VNGAFHDGPGANFAGPNFGPSSAGQSSAGQSSAGWYPDPTDPRGLRYWDGVGWTDHRAQLSGPAVNPAVCSCGVVATGSCRVCGHPFCRAHISEHPREDRAYLRRWDAWTCGGCIELGRRELRAEQLARCESVAPHLAALGTMRRVRTYTGLRPRKVSLFERVPGVNRPPRAAQAYLIEYDAGEENSTYQGLAISADGNTVYDVGVPMLGVKSAHAGPKRRRSGYHLRRAISIEALREAAAAPTEQTWFEYASRAYLRAAKRLMIEPDQAVPPALSIVEVAPEPDLAALAAPTATPIDVPPAQVLEVVTEPEPAPATVTELSPPGPGAARPGNRRSRRAAAR
jgi:hypothetical protein